MRSSISTFACTAFLEPTNHARMLLYFPSDRIPRIIEAFQITKNGEFHKHSMKTQKYDDRNLWIVDCKKPLKGAEMYVVWDWKAN